MCDVMWNDGLWEGRRAPEFSKLINPDAPEQTT
jgi:hypothetical protein